VRISTVGDREVTYRETDGHRQTDTYTDAGDFIFCDLSHAIAIGQIKA